MISNKRGASYEERLKNIGPTNLTERRGRGDMIEVFRTMKGFNKVEKQEWFTLRDPATARATRSTVSISEDGPEQRQEVIFKSHVRLEARKHFFTERVAQEWNALPDSLRNQKSVNAFKNQFDGWMKKNRHDNN